MTGDMPMPPDRYQELVRERARAPRPDPLAPVPRRDPAATTSPLAAELLAEAGQRRLESGELLLVSEEAGLVDLEAAAGRVPPAPPRPAAGEPAEPAAETMLALLAEPRLFSPRVDAAMGWQPPLAELLRLLGATLQAGHDVRQTMLVGHVETFPERVEHLMRLRHLLEEGRGRLALTVAGCDLDTLPDDEPRMREIVRAARPADPSLEVRHARAVAALALGREALAD
jgi:hypothetical protein